MNRSRSLGRELKNWTVIALLALGTALALASPPSCIAQPLPAGPARGAPLQTGAPTGQPTAPLTDIHDIKPLVHLGRSVSPWLYGAIAAAVLAVAGLVFFLIRRRRKTRAAVPPPPLPPEVLAISQLDRIRNVDAVDGRQFYFGLSATLREYMEGRYGLNAPEMTTEELLPQVDPLGLPQGLTAPLKALLLSADPIKYAAAAAVKRKMENDLAFAYKFVNLTAPTDPAMPSSD